MNLKRVLLWVLGVVLALVVVGAGLFVWWGTHPLGPTDTALAALSTDASVTVSAAPEEWVFTPRGIEPTAALVFYPGGHVDARSYAPYAHDVAAHGYLVVIRVMPLSLAVLSPDSADKTIAARPQIGRWVISGHSLGGAMAAEYAAKHTRKLSGLVLLAAYASRGDLSGSRLRVSTLVGSLDTVINRENLAAGKKLLPADAEYVTLEGGNHAQFGDYGLQPGDDPNPTMPAAVQRREAVDHTVQVLREAAAAR